MSDDANSQGAGVVNFRDRVNDYIKRFNETLNEGLPEEQKIEFKLLDAQGYTAVKKGSATVGINVLEDHGILLFLSAIMKVPEPKQLELYRKLLELNFLATSDGAFAIDARNNQVYLRALRGLEGLDYEEFVDILNTVAEVADEWDDKLRQEFGS